MKPLHLVGIVGSLRTHSVSRATARAALAHLPAEVALTLHDIADVPLFNGDLEAELPPAVVALNRAVMDCDGLVFFSPEYNGSFPAVTKNVIDWISRPPKAWTNKPMTMVTLSPGGRAGQGVLGHFSQVMEHLPVRAFETLGMGRYSERLDEHGEVVEPKTLEALRNFIARFAHFCRTPDA